MKQIYLMIAICCFTTKAYSGTSLTELVSLSKSITDSSWQKGKAEINGIDFDIFASDKTVPLSVYKSKLATAVGKDYHIITNQNQFASSLLVFPKNLTRSNYDQGFFISEGQFNGAAPIFLSESGPMIQVARSQPVYYPKVLTESITSQAMISGSYQFGEIKNKFSNGTMRGSLVQVNKQIQSNLKKEGFFPFKTQPNDLNPNLLETQNTLSYSKDNRTVHIQLQPISNKNLSYNYIETERL